MRIGRTLPPAATPIGLGDLWSGLRAVVAGRRELDRFGSELKAHFGVRHCFLVSSGKAAFALILLALHELSPDRDEVLIPAYTCYSVPSSIVRAGLRLRLCDLQADCFDFDFTQLSRMLSRELASKTLAVVPTHLFGFAADVARVRDLAQGTGVAVVEDAAQAMGEGRAGRMAGTLGDAGFFSLGRGKALSAVEGGVILTDRDDLAAALERLVRRLPGYGPLRQLGLVAKAAALMVLAHPGLFWLPRALPFLRLGETLYEPHFPMLAMSAFQAGLARNWRRRLEAMQAGRRDKARRWFGVLEAAGVPGPRIPRDRLPALLRFPLRIGDRPRRDFLLREAAERGLGIMPAYPTAINAIPALRDTLAGGAFPVAERCASELVTLPTHAYLTEADFAILEALVARALDEGAARSKGARATFAGQP